MKKKYCIISAIVCALGFAAIFATKACAECSFKDDENIYYCALDEVICQSAPAGCKGIKFVALPLHPDEL